MTVGEFASALGNTVTIIRVRGRRLAKAIRADGTIEAYDAARTVDLVEIPIADVAALERLLLRLEQRWDCCIVRGAIADPARVRGVRRLLHPDPKTGDVPTLRDVPKRWVALDFDDLPRPEGIEPTDLSACARVAIRALPKAFHETLCIVQATASHGIAPGIRLRLWHRLDRPTSGAELKRWLRHAPIDASIFGAAQVIYSAAQVIYSAAQVIYSAAPLFLPGAYDSLSTRIAVVPGSLPEVIVPPAAALAFARRKPLARLAATGLLSEDAVRAGLVGAATMAGLGDAEAAAVVAWGLAHPATSPPRGIRR